MKQSRRIGKRVALDPRDAYPYNGLGNAFLALRRYDEAIEEYRKFIDLADKEDNYWIKRAEEMIAKLQNK